MTTRKPVHNRIGALLASIAATLIAAAAVAGAFPAASQSAAAACQVYAEFPYWQGFTLVGAGGASCSTSRKVTVLLRQDRPWRPDRTLAERSQTGRFVDIAVYKSCSLLGDSMRVYTETRTSSGQKVQSGRLLVGC